MRLNQLSKHFCHSECGKKEVIRCQDRFIRQMTHQIDVLSAQKCSCLRRYVTARIVVVKTNFLEQQLILEDLHEIRHEVNYDLG